MTVPGVGPGALAGVLTLVALALMRAGVHERRRAAAAGRLPSGPGRPGAIGGDLVARLGRRVGPGSGLAPGPGAPGVGGKARAWLGRRLEEAGVSADPGPVLRAWVGGGVLVVAAVLVTAGPGAAGLAGALAAAGPPLAWRLVRHRGAAGVEAALPAVVEAVAAGLRSGASLRQALAAAAGATSGPLAGDLTRVAAATERGAGVVTSLERWAERRPLPGVRLVVAALCLGAETGGAAAQAVDGVALTLRQRLAAQAEARALATQARVSAVVIGASPVVFCALAAATDARTAAFLLRTPLGLGLLASGLALDAAGALWMARLTRLEP